MVRFPFFSHTRIHHWALLFAISRLTNSTRRKGPTRETLTSGDFYHNKETIWYLIFKIPSCFRGISRTHQYQNLLMLYFMCIMYIMFYFCVVNCWKVGIDFSVSYTLFLMLYSFKIYLPCYSMFNLLITLITPFSVQSNKSHWYLMLLLLFWIMRIHSPSWQYKSLRQVVLDSFCKYLNLQLKSLIY